VLQTWVPRDEAMKVVSRMDVALCNLEVRDVWWSKVEDIVWEEEATNAIFKDWTCQHPRYPSIQFLQWVKARLLKIRCMGLCLCYLDKMETDLRPSSLTKIEVVFFLCGFGIISSFVNRSQAPSSLLFNKCTGSGVGFLEAERSPASRRYWPSVDDPL